MCEEPESSQKSAFALFPDKLQLQCELHQKFSESVTEV